MKRILSALLIVVLLCTLTACSNQPVEPSEPPESPPATSDPAETPDNSMPPESTAEPTPEPTPEREPYAALDILEAEFNPFGMDMPITVFAA